VCALHQPLESTLRKDAVSLLLSKRVIDLCGETDAVSKHTREWRLAGLVSVIRTVPSCLEIESIHLHPNAPIAVTALAPDRDRKHDAQEVSTFRIGEVANATITLAG